jgi:uncharacterized protein YndB with AHSA1/START domain
MAFANEKSNTADRELKITRLLNAPVALVWKVWTEPEHIKNWWGPNGFTNSISEMNVTPGGKWNLVMHGPDGTDYDNRSIYKEVVKHKRIVYEHISPPKILFTIEFEAQGDKTLLLWTLLFESKEVLEDAVKKFGAAEGLKQNVEKLAVHLEGMKQ